MLSARAGEAREMRKKSLVAAIDFGTTYSSCAYSFKDDFEKESLRISINDRWLGADVATMRVPTSVLLDRKKNFDSFGYQAEKKFATLALNNEHTSWYFFRRFKMTLHNNRNLARNTEIEDEKGRKMRALIIFSMTIADIKKQLIENLVREGHKISNEDIHWVLTVPAIWTEAAKQFMQEAAEEAGITKDQFTLALEPEAAAVFCKEYTSHNKQNKALLTTFNPGSKYLVLDL